MKPRSFLFFSLVNALMLSGAIISQPAILFADGSSSSSVPSPSLSFSESTSSPGSSFGITVYGQNFANVSAGELSLHYSTYFTPSGNYNGYFLNGATSTLASPSAGTTNFSFATSGAINGNGDLFTMWFNVASTCPVGDYTIDLAVGGFYDKALNPISIPSLNNKVHIQTSTSSNSLSPSSSFTPTSIAQGKTTTFALSCSYSYHMASAQIAMAYDASKLKFNSFTFVGSFLSNDLLFSVNSKTAGTILVSAASTTGKDFWGVFANAVFTSLIDQDTTTVVSADITEVYDASLKAIRGGTVSSTLTLTKSLPTFSGTDISLSAPQAFDVTLSLSGTSKIAAADFIVTYDSLQLCATQVTSLAKSGQFLTINPTYNAGSIKFSFIDTSGISSDQNLIKISFAPQSLFRSIDTTLTYSATDAVDVASKAVNLNYIPTSIKAPYSLTSVNYEESWIASLTPKSQSFADANNVYLYCNAGDSLTPSFNGMAFTGAIDCVLGTSDLTYTIADGAVTITGYSGSDTAITIPSMMHGYPVRKIGDSAFSGNSRIVSVNFPNTLTSIGTNAFYGCSTLTSLIFPSSITSYGDGAFFGANQLHDVKFLSSSVPASLGNDLFGYAWDSSYFRILVPVASLSAYKAIANSLWQTYAVPKIYGYNSDGSIASVHRPIALAESTPSEPFTQGGSLLTCQMAGTYHFVLENGTLTIEEVYDGTGFNEAYNTRASQYAALLKVNTDGVTICDASGFLSEKKIVLEALLKEYEAFPTALKNQVAATPCFDSLTCGDVLSILYRGDHKNADPSLGLSLTNSDSFVPVTLFSIAMLGLAFVATGIYIHIRKKTDD